MVMPVVTEGERNAEYPCPALRNFTGDGGEMMYVGCRVGSLVNICVCVYLQARAVMWYHIPAGMRERVSPMQEGLISKISVSQSSPTLGTFCTS